MSRFIDNGLEFITLNPTQTGTEPNKEDKPKEDKPKAGDA